MMRSIPFVLRIKLIYIIVNLFNCSVNAEQTEYLGTALNDRQQNLFDVPTSGNRFTYDGDSRVPNDDRIESSQPIDENSIEFSSKSNDFFLLDNNGEFDSLNETTTRHKRDSERADICNIAECTCKLETKFLTVDCHFQQSYTLDHTKLIRPAAETLLIKLSRNAQFRLGGNVFTDNSLNRIMIQGNGMHSGEHVDILPNAFYGNSGPFPEIEIVNVHTVKIQSNAFYSEFKLNVTNCAKVSIFPEAFANTTFHGHFENIYDFYLKERAFSKSSAIISIERSKLDEIQPLEASLKEIKFSNSRIGEIKYKAFDVLQINSIVFENCTINTIKGRALTDKLNSNHFALTGCVIGTIEKSAIYGSGISEIILQNNNITNIQTKAIRVYAVTTLIQGNNFDFTEMYWFYVEPNWTNVLVENNHFGVYHQMKVEIASQPNRCIFENNFITKTFQGSLSFKDPNCKVKQVSFDQLCSCNATYFRLLSHIDISKESYCKIDRVLAHCFNASLYQLKAYKEDICDDSTQIDCVRDRINAKPNGYFIDLNRMFNRNEKLLYVYLGGGVLLIIVIIVLLTLIICRCMKKKKNVEDGLRDLALMESLHPTTATLNVQRFDQTYRPTFEIFPHTNMMIINKTLEDMKHKYPPELYDQIYNNTQKLIVGNLTETDKVKTIGEIVQCIGECENTDVDFKAFTDILYNHLESGNEPVHQINAPIYAEPSLTRLDVLPQMERQNDLNPVAGAIDAGGVAVGAGEHIYAEPVAMQQPLLRSEYNVPIDNNENPNHMYSEPITGAIDYVSSVRPANQIDLTPNRSFDPSHLYAKPSTSAKNRKKSQPQEDTQMPSTSFSSNELRSNLPKISQFKNSAHSSSQESNNSHSDYSGGSGATLPLDD